MNLAGWALADLGLLFAVDLVTFAEYAQYIGAEDPAKLNQERIEAAICG